MHIDVINFYVKHPYEGQLVLGEYLLEEAYFEPLEDRKDLGLMFSKDRLSDPYFNKVKNGKWGYWRYKLQLDGHTKYTLRIYLLTSPPQFPGPEFFIVQVVHPDRAILDYLSKFLHPYKYHISMLEIAMDLKPKINFKRTVQQYYRFMKYHSFLKHVKKLYRGPIYKTTIYYNDIRGTTSKGLRVYIKDIKKKRPYIRIDFVARTRYLAMFNIKTIKDLEGIDVSLLTAPIVFRNVKLDLLRKRYLKNKSGSAKAIMTFKLFKTICSGFISRRSLNHAQKFMLHHVERSCLKKHPFEDKFRSLIAGVGSLL